MQSLIGDRFLKRFFGSHRNRRRLDPASAAMPLPPNQTDKPDKRAYTCTEKPTMSQAVLGNGQTGEVHQLAGSQSASDQPMTDDYPLTSDEPENG